MWSGRKTTPRSTVQLRDHEGVPTKSGKYKQVLKLRLEKRFLRVLPCSKVESLLALFKHGLLHRRVLLRLLARDDTSESNAIHIVDPEGSRNDGGHEVRNGYDCQHDSTHCTGQEHALASFGRILQLVVHFRLC